MGAFTSWILSILGVVIIGTILDIFLSGKKLGKQIRSVLSALLVLMIISPIPILLTNLRSCEADFGQIELDDSFLEFANSRKVAALERGLVQAFINEGWNNIKVDIIATIDVNIRISFVTIDLTNVVLNFNTGNINIIERARNMAADFLNIERSQVLVIE
ncbi:MAG: hypothetical protein FWE03_02110 [Firmicutes bacterium]|nr:hypothetical protein [Bacillota bacterium]